MRDENVKLRVISQKVTSKTIKVVKIISRKQGEDEMMYRCVRAGDTSHWWITESSLDPAVVEEYLRCQTFDPYLSWLCLTPQLLCSINFGGSGFAYQEICTGPNSPFSDVLWPELDLQEDERADIAVRIRTAFVGFLGVLLVEFHGKDEWSHLLDVLREQLEMLPTARFQIHILASLPASVRPLVLENIVMVPASWSSLPPSH